MIYFYDTNFLMHGKASQDIDWKSLTKDKDIIIYICYPVLSEIDKHKLNPQKSRKTRKIQKLLSEMMRQDGQKVYNRDDVTITLKLLDVFSQKDIKINKNLDMSVKDDEIIANVLAFNKLNNEKASLITSDYGMYLKAKNFIDVVFANEFMMLPIKDDVEKENERLKQELTALEKKEPKITIGIYMNGKLLSKNKGNNILSFKLFKELSATDRTKILDDIKRKYPRKHNFSKGNLYVPNYIYTDRILNTMGKCYKPPTETEIKKYNSKYDDWLRNQEAVLDKYVEKHNENFLTVPICIKMENSGNVPATSFQLTLSSPNGFFFETENIDEYKEKNTGYFYMAPEAPTGGYVDKYAMLSPNFGFYDTHLESNFEIPLLSRINTDAFNNIDKQEKDKFEFYLYYEDDYVKIECDEFQHQKVCYEKEIFFTINKETIKNNRILIQIEKYSNNISKVEKITYEIILKTNYKSAKKEIENEIIFPPDLQRSLQ